LQTSLEKTHELIHLDSNGIEAVEADNVKIICHQTLTKIKFIFVVDSFTNISDCEIMFRRLYDIYSDFVSKNPFYEVYITNISSICQLDLRHLIVRLLNLYINYLIIFELTTPESQSCIITA
jgi:hypothetical protein